MGWKGKWMMSVMVMRILGLGLGGLRFVGDLLGGVGVGLREEKGFRRKVWVERIFVIRD